MFTWKNHNLLPWEICQLHCICKILLFLTKKVKKNALYLRSMGWFKGLIHVF